MDWGATNGSPVVEWADRAHVGDVNYATPAGVPIEVMIDLANTLHVDPWFCVPHQASDDYVRQFAALLHSATRSGAAPAHRVLERGLEHRLRADHLGQRALAGARPRQPVRPAGDLLCEALGADLQAHPGRLRRRQRPHRARARRPGGLGQLPDPHAGLQGHRRQRRRDGDRALLQRRRRRRSGAGGDDARR